MYPPRLLRPLPCLFIAAFWCTSVMAIEATVSWTCTTDGDRWAQMPGLTPLQAEAGQPEVSVNANAKCQRIRGWGGCFNEKGWDILLALPKEERQAVIKAFFDPKDGCRFTMGRVPIAGSDYTMDNEWYSYNETAGDYAMKDFSIDRDRVRLIPFIKAAMVCQPKLQIWASPWSAPRWLVDVSGDKQHVTLKTDSQSLDAYGLYFVKFVEAYRAEGINLFAVMPQNEPCWDQWNSKQPIHVGVPAETWYLWVSHLVKAFSAHAVPCDIWLGTLLDSGHGGAIHITRKDYIDRIMTDAALAPHIKGVGVQYGSTLINDVHKVYPTMELMQTETPCGDAKDTWGYGEGQFDTIVGYLKSGAGSYMLWNLVLDAIGASTENWRQCAPVKIDRKTHQVVYHPQFFAYKHFSRFVDPGAFRLESKGSWWEEVSFLNPDGARVVVIENKGNAPRPISIRIDTIEVKPTLPAHSWNTFVYRPTDAHR